MTDDKAPRTVRALVCTKLAEPSEAVGRPTSPLQLVQQPVQLLPSNGVRIRVAAAAINFADALQIKGEYQELQEKPKLPFVPGSEVSGTVIEAGRDVRTLAPGDRVCAVLPGGGAFAEEAVARAASVLKLPPGVDLEAAAGLPVAFGTAYLALRDRADLRPGQTLLVLGAGGGVGLAAVQLGKTMGARVVAVARGRPKMEALRAAGADECIDMEGRKWEQLPALVRPAASQGVDVVFDPVGGAALEAALRCVRWGAQLLVIGFASGHPPKLPANILLVKNVTVHGIYWGSYQQHSPRLFRRSLEEVGRLLAAGDIEVAVSHKYSLAQAGEAFSVLRERGVVGKMLLLPGPRSML